MPELNAVHIVIIAAMIVVGGIIGWVLRARRAQREKTAIAVGWQEQLNAQYAEQDRLSNQSKSLMDRISQIQSSNVDANNRARQLSEAVQEADNYRDELQREIKDIRSHLEVAIIERDQLRSGMSSRTTEDTDAQQRDARIAKLQLELDKWANRLPPLVEKFRQRSDDAERLEAELAVARERIVELEASVERGQTRVDPAHDSDESDDASISHLREKLQTIKGIGPAIEKTLNEMGIFRFEQIADMSEYDIDRIAKRLKGFRSRIYREDWIGQARELSYQDSVD